MKDNELNHKNSCWRPPLYEQQIGGVALVTFVLSFFVISTLGTITSSVILIMFLLGCCVISGLISLVVIFHMKFLESKRLRLRQKISNSHKQS
jgi:heme/copper-type cytochrome/quinol oxidase subunit 4